MNKKARLGWLAAIGPGVLIAATGVGAGDLATGAFTGSVLGVVVLWAVVVGALLKFVVNEGLARWQLATGTTLLEGSVNHLGWWVQWLFLAYLLTWSFFVGTALMSAVGITMHAIWPLFDDINHSKVVFGVAHSLVAVVLVRLGGYRLFEKVMSFCIAVMFSVVVTTAISLVDSWPGVFAGLLIPHIPQLDGEGLVWTVALMGGVGGTLTVLCYGYWIREEGRQGEESLRPCRIDLAAAYLMTAFFGIAMVIIGSQVGTGGQSGARLIVHIGDELARQFGGFGAAARWAFLAGAWGAVFSSLLGVWQSVPYLFADFWQLMQHKRKPQSLLAKDAMTKSRGYRGYLYALATIPALGMFFDFQTAQKIYAVFGAFFIPMLAAVLLVLNGREKWVGSRNRNSWLTTIILSLAIGFFVTAAFLEARRKLFAQPKKAAVTHSRCLVASC